jgi:hypothetical protein
LKKNDYNYTITDSPPLSVIQNSFPTCMSHPRRVNLHCHTVHRQLHLPFLGIQQQAGSGSLRAPWLPEFQLPSKVLGTPQTSYQGTYRHTSPFSAPTFSKATQGEVYTYSDPPGIHRVRSVVSNQHLPGATLCSQHSNFNRHHLIYITHMQLS